MTDNEIIKELQAVSEWFTEHGKNTNTSVIEISKRAIDLINRQKEKIEEQKMVIEAIDDNMYPLPFETDFDKAIKKAKSEAIKEFAERLKKRIGDKHFQNYGYALLEIIELAQEMTEVNENDRT